MARRPRRTIRVTYIPPRRARAQPAVRATILPRRGRGSQGGRTGGGAGGGH